MTLGAKHCQTGTTLTANISPNNSSQTKTRLIVNISPNDSSQTGTTLSVRHLIEWQFWDIDCSIHLWTSPKPIQLQWVSPKYNMDILNCVWCIHQRVIWCTMWCAPITQKCHTYFIVWRRILTIQFMLFMRDNIIRTLSSLLKYSQLKFISKCIIFLSLFGILIQIRIFDVSDFDNSKHECDLLWI